MSLSINSAITLPSGHSMPLLGLGVFQNTGPSVTAACAAAFKAGYRHVDSAQTYWNEAEVGKAFEESGLHREDVFITTKVVSGNHGYQKTLDGIDRSLANFGMDYLDLFLIHDPRSGKERRLETWKAMIKARDEGKLRSIGVSNYGVPHLEEIVAASLELPAVNQVELHPFCQQRPIVEWCREHNVVIQAYTPLIRGKKWDNPVLKQLSEKYGKSIAQVLVRWSLQMGYSPLPKSSQPDRISENADLYDFELDEKDMESLVNLDMGDSGSVTWNPIYAA